MAAAGEVSRAAVAAGVASEEAEASAALAAAASAAAGQEGAGESVGTRQSAPGSQLTSKSLLTGTADW